MRRLSRYTLLERIAQGPSSEIYRAVIEAPPPAPPHDSYPRSPPVGTHAAVKLIKQRIAVDTPFGEMLFREANAAMRFRHRAAVNIFDITSENGEVLIAMELIDGWPLSDVLQRSVDEGRPLARELVLWIAAEVASVLHAGHSARMIHGELSPSNVLVTREGWVKVLGMGIGRSRMLLPVSLARLPYRAPEMVESNDASDLSDVYSLGVMIYDALTGDHVFRRPSAVETKTAILRGKFDRLKERADYVSEIVDELVWQMMSRRPESRPQSPEYVERALRSHVRAADETLASRLADHLRRLGKTREVDAADVEPIELDSESAFGGKTEPMARIAPPSTDEEDALVRAVTGEEFEDKTPFVPMKAIDFPGSEQGVGRDPFDDTTPLAAPTLPLGQRATVAPRAEQPPIEMAMLPPAQLPVPRAPSTGKSPSGPVPLVAPHAPSADVTAPLAVTPIVPSPPSRTPPKSTTPAPRAPSKPAPEETTAPLPRAPSSSRRPPPAVSSSAPTPVHPAPPARSSSGSGRPTPSARDVGADFLTASDLLADLLDTIDTGPVEQVRAFPSQGAITQPMGRAPSSSNAAPRKLIPTPPAEARPRAVSGSGQGLQRDRMGPTASGAAAIAGTTDSKPNVQQIGRYEVIADVGRHGAAHLYDARSTPSGEPVRLQVLDSARIDDPRLRPEEWATAFGREVSISRKLSYPGLPRLIEAGQDNTLQFIAYDRVEGVPLSIVVGRGKLLDPESLRKLIASVALALSYLHERGIAYCNVHAQSVMMTRDGLARLNDLSMAAPIGGPMHPLLGTNIFSLSPEYLSGQAYGAASDQFALGALLYELLTNTRPFRGLDDRMILAAIREKDPLPPHTIDSRVNPFLSEVAMRALQKQPEKRFPSCDALAQALIPR